jgi:hypothetical protein
MLTGDPGSPRRALEKITTALDLFDHLRTRCLLSCDNILFLQAMLYHARRIDLLNKLLEYGRTREHTLHCYPEHNIGKSTNEHRGKLKRQPKMDDSDTLATLGTRHRTRQTKLKHNIEK